MEESINVVNAPTEMPSNGYEKLVGRLYCTPFFHPSYSGLSNISKLYQLIGSPLCTPCISVIHVAGTNGKGSVCLKLSKTLQLMGFHVGCYTSPHVSCFRERIQWNGQLISEQEVVEDLPRIFQICEQHDIPAIFFEVTTTLAMLFFERMHRIETTKSSSRRKTIIIIEAGLGGRLDTTNVLPSTSLSIITSVGLDHTQILGDTIELIALDKAGIMRPQTPVLVGSNVPMKTLQDYAHTHNIQYFYSLEKVFQEIIGEPVPSKNDMDYDAENSSIVRAALVLLQKSHCLFVSNGDIELTATVLQQGLSVRPPCRFEYVAPPSTKYNGIPAIILDVAHNPLAMTRLVQKLTHEFPVKAFRFVIGMSKDKDWKNVLQCLKPLLKQSSGKEEEIRTNQISGIYLVQSSHIKAAPLEQLLAEAEKLLSVPPSLHTGSTNLLNYDKADPSPAKGMLAALDASHEKQDILIVCGSVYLMSEVRKVLCYKEARDSVFLEHCLSGKVQPRLFGNGKVK